MATMTSKDMHIAIKRDNGLEYLMERFGMSDSNEVLEAMRKADPINANDFFKRLLKKQKRISKRENDLSATSIEEPIVQAEQTQELKEESAKYEQNAWNIQLPEESVEEEAEQDKQDISQDKKLSLEQLHKEEQELSDLLRGVEVQHKDLVSKRRAINERLANAQKALEELNRLRMLQNQNVLRLYEEFEAAANQMDILNEDRRVYAMSSV